MKSTPDMKTNAKLRRDAATRRQPRIVTDAISKSINLHLTTSTAASSGGEISSCTGFRRSVAPVRVKFATGSRDLYQLYQVIITVFFVWFFLPFFLCCLCLLCVFLKNLYIRINGLIQHYLNHEVTTLFH